MLGAPVSSFGFALAAHPQEPDTAWSVPSLVGPCRVPAEAGLAVKRTRDSGRSFDSLRRGLPQEHCYDLVCRHGLALAADGHTLPMGSTIGNLRGSTDAGNTWQPVAQHLPPIHPARLD